MKLFKILLGVGLTLIIVFSATAKEQTWDQKLEAATKQVDTDARLESLQTMLEQAENSEHKIILNYYIAQTHVETSHYGSAIAPLEMALELNDEYSPGNFGFRNAISELLTNAYLMAGKVDKATEVGLANVRLNDVLLADIWSQSPEGLTHRSSNLKCPHSMAGMVRTKTTNYKPIGSDVSCGYRQLIEEMNEVTLYFTNHGEKFDDQADAHQAAASAMARMADKQNGELVTQRFKLEPDVSYMTDITETVYEYGRGEAKQYTGAWTAIIQGWVLKTRVTWDASLGVDYGRQVTRTVFEESSQGIPTHLQTCQVTEWPEKGDVTSKMGLEYLMSELVIDQNKAKTQRPDTECFILASERGNAFLVGHTEGTRLYTIDGEAVKADVYVEASQGIGGIEELATETEYVLKAKTSASDETSASIHIMKAYGTRPGPSQVFTDFVAVYSGKLDGYGKIEISENGDTNIVMSPGLVNTEE